jgi:hypothetical protein
MATTPGRRRCKTPNNRGTPNNRRAGRINGSCDLEGYRLIISDQLDLDDAAGGGTGGGRGRASTGGGLFGPGDASAAALAAAGRGGAGGGGGDGVASGGAGADGGSGGASRGLLAQVVSDVMYGLINVVVLVPVMVGFAQIIFRDRFFHDHNFLPAMVKLVMFSSMVHQLAFTFISSLPFAIGQVQDAGLIFLSAMATSIVALASASAPLTPLPAGNATHNATAAAAAAAAAEVHARSVLATVIVCTALSTALLGVILVFIGRVRLASLVQYLPQPVVGGYLGYVDEHTIFEIQCSGLCTLRNEKLHTEISHRSARTMLNFDFNISFKYIGLY